MDNCLIKKVTIVIDSFGRKPNGLIVAIRASATSFKLNSEQITTQHFYETLNAEEAVQETRFDKDNETLRWWRDFKTEEYEALYSAMEKSTLNTEGLLTRFFTWLKPFCDQRYALCFGAEAHQFDYTVLRNACHVVGQAFPGSEKVVPLFKKITIPQWALSHEWHTLKTR